MKTIALVLLATALLFAGAFAVGCGAQFFGILLAYFSGILMARATEAQ